MQLLPASLELREKFAREIPDLVWATGPASYDYHFADRSLFNIFVEGSWVRDGTLFAADATTLAVENEELMGIMIAMTGPELGSRKEALGPVWQDLVASDRIEKDDIAGVRERSDHASWLNPVVYSDTYYIHALSVKPEFCGRRLGYGLIQHAINTARELGLARLQLDVLSDNPAVDFYRAVGFELLAETRTPKPSDFGVPSVYRMGMPL